MGSRCYISLFNTTGQAGHVALFSSSKGGETAGSVANNGFSSSSSISSFGGETAGSVASSSGGCSSGGCSSFTAIA